MMITLMRHGKAAPSQPDFSRPLLPEGETEVRRACEELRLAGLSFQKILHSPLLRARQTADLAKAIFAHAVMVEEPAIGPDDDPAYIKSVIEGWGRQILVVSHLPLLEDLALLLTDQHVKLRTADFIVLKPNLPFWTIEGRRL